MGNIRYDYTLEYNDL